MARHGEKRFCCQCGARMADGLGAMQHMAAGHEVVLEVYRFGRWDFHRQPVAELVIEQMVAAGRDVPAFLGELDRMGDKLEAMARYERRN